jgi:hypothetical protein
MKTIFQRENRSTCGLDKNQINNYIQHYKKTFGGTPEGNENMYN